MLTLGIMNKEKTLFKVRRDRNSMNRIREKIDFSNLARELCRKGVTEKRKKF